MFKFEGDFLCKVSSEKFLSFCCILILRNVIGFAPSLLTTMAEANDIVMRLTEVLNEVEEILHVPKRWREEVKNVGTKK